MAQNYGLRRNNRMTVYDQMEAAGKFASNPANADAMDETGESLYKGPVEYPKMMYHPEGKKTIVRAASVEPSPTGPVHVPPMYELIHAIVQNADEEAELRAEGWHDHPADAIEASGEEPPPTAVHQSPDAIRREMERLQKQLDKAEAASAKALSHPEKRGGRSVGTSGGLSL